MLEWLREHTYLTHEDAASVPATFGNCICSTHVHDNDRRGDHHWTPLTGTINWEEEMAALSAVHYSGYLTMEWMYDHLYENTDALYDFVRTAYDNCCKLEGMMGK